MTITIFLALAAAAVAHGIILHVRDARRLQRNLRRRLIAR